MAEPQLRVPGPTPLPAAVREAGSRQMVNHRGPEFRELIGRVTAGLQRAFRTENEILIITASGTGGLEAAVVNHLSVGDPVLAVSIGSFGDRFAAIAKRYGADVTKIEVEWGNAAKPDALREAIDGMRAAGRSPKAILITHNETSTGVTNPLESLAAAARDAARDALLLIDGISGLGAVPFEADGWGLDVVVTGSQKSWMVPPGLAMLSVSARARAAEGEATMPRYYFDLEAHRKSAAKGETPWTPAVSVCFALDVSLKMLDDEGLDAVFARLLAAASAVRAGLEALGFALAAERGYASDTVTAAWLPDGLAWPDLDRELRARGLIIAGGQDKLAGKICRVGHLGAVQVGDMIDAIGTIEDALVALGRPVDRGVAVRAARAAAAGMSADRTVESGSGAREATAAVGAR